MNGGRHVAKERGMIMGTSTYRKIKALMEDKPWLVMKVLSTMSESDRKSLKWILARV